MGWLDNATPWPLYCQERSGTHCIGGWVGPSAGLDGCGKSRPYQDSIPGPFSRSESLYWLHYPGPWDEIVEFMCRDKTNVDNKMFHYSCDRATGMVAKVLKRNLEAIRGKHSLEPLQKTVVRETSHIIRKVLQSETWSLSGKDHYWFKSRNARKERSVTRDSDIIIIIIIIIISKYC